MLYFLRTHWILIIFVLVFTYFFWILYSLSNSNSKLTYLRDDIAKKNQNINELSNQIAFIKSKWWKNYKEKTIKSYDLPSDNSITKFVNSSVSFNDKKYVPENLESISSDFIIDSKGNWKIIKIANTYLEKMSEVFYRNFWKKIIVVSSYRSYAYQKGIKDRWCPDNLCAKAWYSEHQSGLAIDLWETTTNNEFMSKKNLKEYYKWLNKNAYKYGFHNTYQKWLEIDWYEIEPWHWRYLWVELATELKSKNITIAEYYNKIKKS